MVFLFHFFAATSTLLFFSLLPAAVQALTTKNRIIARQPGLFGTRWKSISTVQTRQRILQQCATTQIRNLRISSSQLNAEIRVRDWKEGQDEEKILDLLRSAESEFAFDPEGPLMVDCGSATAIRESYDPNDGGFFLVATDNGDDEIVGIGALIIGTPITYSTSGASRSFPDKVTGAARRLCTSENAQRSSEEKSTILQCLLTEIEKRATRGGATELIILAYPATTTTRRPNSSLLEERGYFELPANLNGVEAVQYCKNLESAISVETNSAVTTTPENNLSAGHTSKTSSSAVDVVIGVSFISILLVALLGVANMMGLELLPSNDNRGIGMPLSTEELQRLKQDEQLQRTDIDGQKSIEGAGAGGSRQWEDLNAEERREEVALMKIIQGQDFRLQ